MDRTMHTQIGYCRVCGAKDQLKNIALYVDGSEGLDICFQCEMRIVEYVRQMKRLAGTCRLLGYAAGKEVREAKQSKGE